MYTFKIILATYVVIMMSCIVSFYNGLMYIMLYTYIRTCVGVGMFLKEKNGDIKVVLADPQVCAYTIHMYV